MARMRSPNFPATSLDEAVKAAKEIYDKNRQVEILREDAAKDIGYTGLTGRSLQVLGALNQYDLLENTSKGQCRITQTTVDILHGYPDEVKASAMRKAGHAPPLFKAIYDRFDGHIPGDNAVRSFLVQSGFTNDGADKALKNFLATNRYLEINAVGESYGDKPGSVPESAPEIEMQEQTSMHTPPDQARPPEAPQQTDAIFWNKGALDFNLSSTGLAVAGKTNSASELKAYIAKLQALLPLLPDEETEH